MPDVFLDTAYAIALSFPRDAFHEQAVSLAGRLREEKLVTTQVVLLEIADALAKVPYRQAATALIDSLTSGENADVVPLTPELFGQALELYKSRVDKTWGLTDCVSFVVMTERGITEALTTDIHFTQAGFRALLRDAS